MTTPRPKKPPGRPLKNQRRERASLGELLSGANRRAHEQANRRCGKRATKSVRAAIAATAPIAEDEPAEWPERLLRWIVGALLLPPCWVTLWTFLSRFSEATVAQGFWQTQEFWFFTTGVLMMIGWFWSGLLREFFLYLYVLGHELTHALFVVLYRGRVTDFYVSTEGGYITTNKTNLVIALSPYFVPFWTVVAVIVHVAARQMAEVPGDWDRAFYAVAGATWTFHFVWTLWMIPRDQPDLKENGTFLSLVVIFFANLLVLVALLCLASDSPLQSLRDFALEWLRHAATWADEGLRRATAAVAELKEWAKLAQ
jgi:hypothetical protein